MKLTEEQKAVVLSLKEHDRIKVNAYAGTGKTHTMLSIARAYPRATFLYLAFNRSIANELRNKVPPNAQVRTFHSLALKLLKGRLKGDLVDEKAFVSQVRDLLDVDYPVARLISRVFSAFCESGYEKVSEENVKKILFFDPKLLISAKAFFENETFSKLADYVEYLFFSIDRGVIGYTHAYYQKIFQLTVEEFSDFFSSFDGVVVDEGQDLNGVQLAVFSKIPVKKKVIVGDRNQSIYGWRGAVNALASLGEEWEEKRLTVCFRFSSERLLGAPNLLLEKIKGEKNLMSIPSPSAYKSNGLTAYLFRTNAGVAEMVGKVEEKVRFLRGIDEIFENLLYADSIHRFYLTGKRIYLENLPPYLRAVVEKAREENPSYGHLMSVFSGMGDEEFANALILVEKMNVYALYEKAKAVEDPRSKTVLATAHSAKGLEFDKVILGEDFPSPTTVFARNMTLRPELFPQGASSDEKFSILLSLVRNHDPRVTYLLDHIHLLYVALTRPIHKISVPLDILTDLETFGEIIPRETPISVWEKVSGSKEGKEGGDPFEELDLDF